MKNLVNYLDDYFDENLEEVLCNRKFGKINIHKNEKKDSINEEKDHSKHKKEKHKNK